MITLGCDKDLVIVYLFFRNMKSMETIMDRRQVISSLGVGLASFGLPGLAQSQAFGAKQTRFAHQWPR